MFFVRVGLVVLMAIGAGKDGIIRRVGMTFHTRIPFLLMAAAVNRKILSIVVEGSRLPGSLGMTIEAGRRKAGSLVWRVAGLILFLLMATKTR